MNRASKRDGAGGQEGASRAAGLTLDAHFLTMRVRGPPLDQTLASEIRMSRSSPGWCRLLRRTLACQNPQGGSHGRRYILASTWVCVHYSEPTKRRLVLQHSRLVRRVHVAFRPISDGAPRCPHVYSAAWDARRRQGGGHGQGGGGRPSPGRRIFEATSIAMDRLWRTPPESPIQEVTLLRCVRRGGPLFIQSLPLLMCSCALRFLRRWRHYGLGR